jgi:TonB family protein
MRTSIFTIAAFAFVWSTAAEGPLAIHAPKPEYPSAARLSHVKGDGLYILRVQIRTGVVKDVQVARSTGSSILDAAAIQTLRKWRFKPGTANLKPIKIQLPEFQDSFAAEDSFVKLPVHFVMRQ